MSHQILISWVFHRWGVEGYGDSFWGVKIDQFYQTLVGIMSVIYEWMHRDYCCDLLKWFNSKHEFGVDTELNLWCVWTAEKNKQERFCGDWALRDMGKLFLVQLDGRVYSCRICKTHLASIHQLLSKVWCLWDFGSSYQELKCLKICK